jgi:hypothetical protein
MHYWNGQDTLPTALYIWKEAELVRGNARRKYREYTDCLDVLTQHQVTLSLVTYVCLYGCALYQKLTQLRNVQVIWCPWDAPELQNYLSPVTRQESDEYRCNVPLIFLPCGRDPLAHQGLQAVWNNYRLPTTALLHQPKIARVHYRFITKL